MLDIIKSNINLGNYKLLQTKSNKIVILILNMITQDVFI